MLSERAHYHKGRGKRMNRTFKSIEVEIPARGTTFPATIVLPDADALCPMVAIAHGFAGTRQEGGAYPELAEALAQRGIASIRCDFPGCGDSKESFRLNTLSVMAWDVRSSISYALENYNMDPLRIGLLGTSLGGRVAMEVFNAGRPQIAAMTLIAPGADTATMMAIVGDESTCKNAYDTALRDGFVAIPRYYGGDDLELTPAWFTDLQSMDTIGNAKIADVPVQIIYAEDDTIVNPRVSKLCAEKYGAQLVEISGDGHLFGFYSERKDIRARVIESAAAFFSNSFGA